MHPRQRLAVERIGKQGLGRERLGQRHRASERWMVLFLGFVVADELHELRGGSIQPGAGEHVGEPCSPIQTPCEMTLPVHGDTPGTSLTWISSSRRLPAHCRVAATVWAMKPLRRFPGSVPPAGQQPFDAQTVLGGVEGGAVPVAAHIEEVGGGDELSPRHRRRWTAVERLLPAVDERRMFGGLDG